MRLIAGISALAVHLVLQAPIASPFANYANTVPFMVSYDVLAIGVFPALWWWRRRAAGPESFLDWFLYYLFMLGLILGAFFNGFIVTNLLGFYQVADFLGLVSYIAGCTGRELLLLSSCSLF
jgi:hypothetical protein